MFARAATINLNGKDYWINGVNIPWNNYGIDAGVHPYWGGGYNPTWFENFFTQCEANGINCTRLWIHCDGRASPEFDAGGYVTGLDPTFLADLGALLQCAASHKVMVMPCLWSFDMTNDNRADKNPYSGYHADLIQDVAKTQSYIDHALIPMVQQFKDTPNLFAWEIINEPEWSIEVIGSTFQRVTKAEMQRFCAMIAEAIHQNSSKMVTVGSACLKWNSDKIPQAEGNYWTDAALNAAYPSSLGHLDFYQIHYYDWCYEWGYDPFQLTRPTTFWQLDKPTLVGECPVHNGGYYTITQMLSNAYANGYIGVMPWSYNCDGPWDDAIAPLKAFHDAHPDIIDYVGDVLAPDVSVTTVTVAGTAYDVFGAPALTVDGSAVALSGVDFTKDVQITTNSQTVVIQASDFSGNTRLVNLTISR
jgi:hypothetical protein